MLQYSKMCLLANERSHNNEHNLQHSYNTICLRQLWCHGRVVLQSSLTLSHAIALNSRLGV